MTIAVARGVKSQAIKQMEPKRVVRDKATCHTAPTKYNMIENDREQVLHPLPFEESII